MSARHLIPANTMSLGTALARFPSLAQSEAHARVGEKYEEISTFNTLEALTGEGFEIAQVMYSRTRDVTRRGFQKHLIRLRHPTHNWGDVHPEIVAVNSFDGSSSWQLWAGVYRFICSNGLVVGTQWAQHRVNHRGDVTARVLEATQAIAGTFDRVATRIDTMRRVHLTIDQQVQFAERAAALRWDRTEAPIPAPALLNARRSADMGDDVWSVYNRIQENAIQGGQSGYNRASRRRFSVRPVADIRGNIALNSALSNLADEYAGIAA